MQLVKSKHKAKLFSCPPQFVGHWETYIHTYIHVCIFGRKKAWAARSERSSCTFAPRQQRKLWKKNSLAILYPRILGKTLFNSNTTSQGLLYILECKGAGWVAAAAAALSLNSFPTVLASPMLYTYTHMPAPPPKKKTRISTWWTQALSIALQY